MKVLQSSETLQVSLPSKTSRVRFRSQLLTSAFLLTDARQYAPSIKARFPADTYALAGQMVTLECFAFGK